MSKHPYSDMSIVVGDSDFQVYDGSKLISEIFYQDISEIIAFKEDLWAYDEICVGIRTDNSEEYFKITESFTGYKDLLQIFESRFPGIVTGWFSDVAFPAFAQNRTILWKKSERQAQQGAAANP